MRFRTSHLLVGAIATVLVAGCDGESPQQKVESYLESAAGKLDAGKHQAAIIEFKNALQIDPENVQARKRLGEVYLNLGRGRSAVKEFEKARRHGATAPRVTANLARARLMTGEPKAVLDLIAAPGHDATYAASDARTQYGLRALALHALDRSADAETLASAVLDAGTAPEARLALSRIALDRGAYTDALAHANAGLDLRPDDPELLWAKAQSLMATSAPGRAMDVLAKARTQPWRPLHVDFAMIELALRSDQPDRAWAVLDDLGAHVPEDPRTKYFQALKLIADGKHDAAAEIANGLTGQYPDFDRAAYLAGIANLRLGNTEMARSFLERFVTANPRNTQARRLLAEAWAQLGNMEKARALAGDSVALGAEAKRRQYASATGTSGADVLDEDTLDPAAKRRDTVRAILRDARNQKFDAALAKTDALAEDMAESPLPGQLAAAVLWMKGDRAAAIARMKETRAAFPDSRQVALNLARMHRNRGDTSAALDVLAAAMTTHPDAAALKVEAARNHAANNDGERVRQLLTDALDGDPESLEARAYLARFHLLKGEHDSAIRVVDAAPGDQAGSTAALLEVKGKAQRAKGDHEAALATFKDLVKAEPGASAGYMDVGRTLIALGRPGDAVGYFEQARARMDEPKRAEILLARALIESGQGDRADRLITELADAHPESPEVAMLRGNHALAFDQDGDRAVAAFRKALANDPSPGRLMSLVRVQTRLGRADAAIRELEAWRTEHDSGVTVTNALAELYLSRDRFGDAARLYRQLVDQRPDNPAFQNNLAWTLAERGELDGALTHARRAIDLAPDNPGIQDTMGVILLRRGDAAGARQHLAKAAKAAPGRPDIQLNYAEALLAAGDPAAAREVLSDLPSENLPAAVQRKRDQLAAKLDG
jgi:tetratricopeptide (TPR) repeat protein